MKKIVELSKEELESAFKHQFPDVNFWEDQFECAACEDGPPALFRYVCDKCEDFYSDKD